MENYLTFIYLFLMSFISFIFIFFSSCSRGPEDGTGDVVRGHSGEDGGRDDEQDGGSHEHERHFV